MPEIHLLFLEDDEVIRLIVTEALVETGFKVTEAGSGEAAMELLQGQHGFNLILADVLLPGRFSGVDVAHQARALYPDIPIVFSTGRPDLLRVLWTHGRHDSSIPLSGERGDRCDLEDSAHDESHRGGGRLLIRVVRPRQSVAVGGIAFG